MKKCQFCGRSTEEVKKRNNGLVLCKECTDLSNSFKSEEKGLDKVVDINSARTVGTEEETSNAPERQVKCEIIVGVEESGALYFDVKGSDANLLIIDGLIKFAARRMKQVWEIRDSKFGEAMQEEATTKVGGTD